MFGEDSDEFDRACRCKHRTDKNYIFARIGRKNRTDESPYDDIKIVAAVRDVTMQELVDDGVSTGELG